VTNHLTRTDATPARKLIVALVAVAAVALGGCSSTSKTSTSATTVAGSAPSYPAGKEQVCQARDQLKSSVEALTKPSLLMSGTSSIKAAVTKVQDDLTSLKSAAKTDYKPQVEAVQTSVKDLQSAVSDHSNKSISQNLQDIGTAISNVGTTSSELFTQLKTSCGS
jgi:hypothetical protein